jgi:hypothetical protein
MGLGLLSGCSGFSSNEKPLPDSTFVGLLTELHLAKARTTIEEPVPPHFRDSLFARHEVDSSAFYNTLAYYSRRPKLFETLYSSVVDTLQSLQHPQKDRPPPNEEVRDSLYRNRRKPGDSP